MRFITILLLLCVGMPLNMFSKTAIHFVPCWGKKTVSFDSTPFLTASGDTVQLSLFKMYVSDIAQGSSTKAVHLIDSDDPTTFIWNIDADIKPGVISFKAGLDSAYNTSGALSGDLDPVKGMYWAWNSGYIMAKLEGVSSASKSVHHAVEYHIGGYRSPYNTVRAVELSVPRQSIEKVTDVYIALDLSVWFSGVDISKQSSVVIPGEEAAAMADRYAKMFSIDRVE